MYSGPNPLAGDNPVTFSSIDVRPPAALYHCRALGLGQQAGSLKADLGGTAAMEVVDRR